jgi:hypothetical protein
MHYLEKCVCRQYDACGDKHVQHSLHTTTGALACVRYTTPGASIQLLTGLPCLSMQLIPSTADVCCEQLSTQCVVSADRP